MRHQPIIALLFATFICVNFTSALVGTKLTKYCKESMGNATSHKVFCRVISDRVTLKAYKVCRKGVTWSCKAANVIPQVNYKECKETLLRTICPDISLLPKTAAPGIEGGSAPLAIEEDASFEDDSDEDELED